VVGEHDQPPAGGEQVDGLRQGGLEGVQLAVDLDAQGLEGPAGRVGTGPPGGCGHSRLDQLDELAGGGDGGTAACLVEGAGDAAREAFLAVLAQDAGELGPRVGGQHLGRGDPGGGVHAHVEGGVGPVAEAAPGLVQLQRRHAEVVEDPVDGVQPQPSGHRGQVGEGGGDGHQPLPRPGQAPAGQGQRGRVAVQPDDPAVGGAGLQEAFAVAAEAEGGVDVDPAGTGTEQLGHAVDHDRLVRWPRQHHQIPSSARWATLVSSL
jgi:hypothetical protein